VLLPRRQANLARSAKVKEHAMSHPLNPPIAVIGVDIDKN
jgi:transposase